ncbi:MAG TPA: NAD(P)-dependent alcohol dehydrogenase [Dehalococcoidales bacterium]|nr:NAD(P)-dependent alcohol dehydrogenase [Dehalococcoidales bacterium]
MKALVLERVKALSLRDIDIQENVGPDEVRIKIKSVGICGSDVHYYEFGAIGNFNVNQPMVLGHEAAGTIIEVGKNVKNLKPNDRVCMEPGIPDTRSRASRLGIYNLDPAIVFWATPPVHGCLRETVVHPAAFTFKLPDNVSLDEGAMIEPLAVGLHAARKAGIKPGDIAMVTGAGTIGMVTALAALAGGCSQVIITDINQTRLDLAAQYGLTPVNIKKQNLAEIVNKVTDGWGIDIIFEASGSQEAISGIFDYVCPGGKVIFIGMPVKPVPVDLVAAQAKEARMETIFRYAHVYPGAVSLLASGKINVKPLITDRYKFEDSIKAYEYAANPRPTSVKVMIQL